MGRLFAVRELGTLGAELRAQPTIHYRETT